MSFKRPYTGPITPGSSAPVPVVYNRPQFTPEQVFAPAPAPAFRPQFTPQRVFQPSPAPFLPPVFGRQALGNPFMDLARFLPPQAFTGLPVTGNPAPQPTDPILQRAARMLQETPTPMGGPQNDAQIQAMLGAQAQADMGGVFTPSSQMPGPQPPNPEALPSGQGQRRGCAEDGEKCEATLHGVFLLGWHATLNGIFN